ncbi:GDSL-type esterase/lipase family protein [Isoptericola sp. NPDC056605]|uniref:GDSL-type esterase/lipase family protein n=1 Tax=Isoptericola sp. NPDC056605 TaxID=3345876 RepID=UPI0036B507C8
MSAAPRGRRAAALLLAAAAVVTGSPAASASPAADAGRPGLGGPRPDAALLEACTGTAPVVCTYPDLPPGHYDVTVMLGDRHGPAGTEVQAEARRLMVPAVDTADGELARRTFTVNVRDPESQQNQPAGEGTPGLTLTFTGDAPHVAGIGIRPADVRTPRLALLGDSTVTDQGGAPYTGWGQRLPAHLRLGVSVVNHSGSGESTVSVLAKPEMFDALVPQLRPGDVALVQLAHNDKTTTAEQYRANLTEIVTRVRATGATPVLVTPIVRLRFDGDQLDSAGLIETAAGSLPQHVRDVAADLDVDLVDLTALSEELVEGLGPVDAQPIYLVRENGDRTHTSWYGAGVYADLVAGELRRLGLVPERYWR